ncbi:MAG TPA: NTP transferase domain-containing protein [Firmicutes bacterium]|nr:NTP transferase domain-containing protein [Bacillota bacterium]
MRVILPVAGVGTRLRPLTHTVPKALVHVAGKPILGHIIDSLLPLGIEEVLLVVGYLGEQVVEYVRSTYDLPVRWVEQPERKGLGHAVYLAGELWPKADEPVLIVLGDTIFSADLDGILTGERSMIAVREVSEPSRFGIVELDGGRIKRLVEKPSDPPSNLAIVGVYYLKSGRKLFAALEEIIRKDIKVKGEYQLTDALQLLIEQGEDIGVFKVDDWLDCGNPETLLLTNRILLSRRNGNSEPPRKPGCIIIPPVYIAPTAKVVHSIIGPYVSIADGAEVEQCILRNSIVNRHAKADNVLLADSIIGEHASVGGTYTKVNVGDSSDIRVTF